MGKYGSIHEWLDECRRLVREDFDVVVLFTGDEGNGKSTNLFQVLCALDPSFDVPRCTFTIADFLRVAPRTGKRKAVALDDPRLNRRHAMSSETVALLDFLQMCRGLNLFIGICFPHEALFEGAILDHRIRFKVEVVQRGLITISKRVKRKYRKPTGEVVTRVIWEEKGSFNTEENDPKNPTWARYRAKKKDFMEGLGQTLVRQAAVHSSGFDVRAVDDVLTELDGEYSDAAAPGPLIRGHGP